MILEELVALAPHNPLAAFTVRSRRTRIHARSCRHLLCIEIQSEERERERERERVCTRAMVEKSARANQEKTSRTT